MVDASDSVFVAGEPGKRADRKIIDLDPGEDP